ncbi:HTH-type transcriptional activator CmpR [bacterium BMS3Bbin12]|nr:HTH-type transcriptional activator CmpR [bacterium BMS3Bbin12]GBE50908.1 HTH-type transcriptional activator CmpR [bacterium BMS3Bbin13]
MHLTLRQLQVFEAVARHRSYTRAARELHLTQPAVSMQIKQLEESLDLPLFEQIGKRIYLTQAGREMDHYARGIARQLADAEAVLEDLKGLKRGHLALAVASTANYFATRLLANFCNRYEDVTFSLDVTNRERLLGHLEQNDTDLVIMGHPPERLPLAAEAFMENPLVLIAPPDHPLVGRRCIPLARLRQERFLVRERASGTRSAMERFFTERGVTLASGMEMNSNEAIKQAVQAGLGLGIVSLHTLALELHSGVLTTLDAKGFPILRHWYLVHRQGKRLSPMAATFRRFVLDEARRLVEPAPGPNRTGLPPPQ